VKAAAIKRAPPLVTLSKWEPVEIIEDVDQGTDEWLGLRLGIPTASNFSMIVRGSESVTRDEYMMKLAGEILTGAPAEGKLITAAMQRGNDMEAEAREHYARTNFGGEVERIGFMRRKMPSGRYVGASPDGLLAKRTGGLEIKTMAPHLMIKRLVNGAGMPPEHRWQVHGTMMVGELDHVVLTLFYRGMPFAPKFTIKRDEAMVKEISDAVEVFDHELHQLVKKVRGMGP
jgi:hypothetical protein